MGHLRGLVGLSLVALVGCRPPTAEGLPQRAEAVALGLEAGRSQTEVLGTVRGDELWVDLDDPADDRYFWRYVVEDAGGDTLYERSFQGPGLVQGFLGYYSQGAGIDLLEALPSFGQFVALVPLLDEGVTVRFEQRDADGVFEDVGRFDLADVDKLDLGLHPGVVDTEELHHSGAPSNRLDIALLGDGYTEAELPKWRQDAEELAEAILSTPPFSTFKGAINIHRIDVASAESGAGYDCSPSCGPRDTAFDSIFPVSLVNSLTGSTYSNRSVVQLGQIDVARAASAASFDMSVVVVNSGAFGGMAVHVASATNAGSDWATIGVHEFGHIAGFLGDEYVSDACIRPAGFPLPENITEDPTDPRWEGWIEPGTELPTPSDNKDDVGAFKGAWNCPDLYRPKKACMMRNYAEFCPVCSELVVKRLFRHVDPFDDLHIEGREIVATGPVLDDITLEIVVDGEVRDEGTPDDPPKLPGRGEFTLRAAVQTDLVRGDLDDLTDDRAFTFGE